MRFEVEINAKCERNFSCKRDIFYISENLMVIIQVSLVLVSDGTVSFGLLRIPQSEEKKDFFEKKYR